MSRPLSKQHGFSLIEILISVLVFSVGVLGLGGLQIASLKGSNNAHYRTTASVLAMDLADRMRSNLNAVSAGRYAEAVNCAASYRLCRIGTACTIEQLATFDIQEIKCGLTRGTSREGGVAGLLPGGTMTIACTGGCITPIGSTRAAHDITISWTTQKTDGEQKNDDHSRSLILSVIP